jgi:hypothetical protein
MKLPKEIEVPLKVRLETMEEIKKRKLRKFSNRSIFPCPI